MAELEIQNLTRHYGNYAAVDDISLRVKEGQFLTLLGPSGCGKSTTLAMIAGLDRPTSGRICVGGEVFFDGNENRFVEAEKRNLGMVFQSYALWPHMTVSENVAFPLRLRRVASAERDKKVREALDLVEMGPFASRYPAQLSGGQQQRVALARTLAYRPRILLLDEPLSNLDAKLRDRARVWLKEIQSQVGITTILVTHDQAEALSLSDTIAVMNQGKIVQFGSPTEIYDAPLSPYVADFVGASNFLPGVVESMGSEYAGIRLDDGSLLDARPTHGVKMGMRVQLACRPERIELRQGEVAEGNLIRAKVLSRSYEGSHTVLTLSSGPCTFRADISRASTENEVTAFLPPDQCFLFPAEPNA